METNEVRCLFVHKGMKPQQKTSTKDKHFTLLRLTALNGDQVISVILFSGKRGTELYEARMDVFGKEEGRQEVEKIQHYLYY